MTKSILAGPRAIFMKPGGLTGLGQALRTADPKQHIRASKGKNIHTSSRTELSVADLAAKFGINFLVNRLRKNGRDHVYQILVNDYGNDIAACLMGERKTITKGELDDLITAASKFKECEQDASAFLKLYFSVRPRENFSFVDAFRNYASLTLDLDERVSMDINYINQVMDRISQDINWYSQLLDSSASIVTDHTVPVDHEESMAGLIDNINGNDRDGVLKYAIHTVLDLYASTEFDKLSTDKRVKLLEDLFPSALESLTDREIAGLYNNSIKLNLDLLAAELVNQGTGPRSDSNPVLCSKLVMVGLALGVFKQTLADKNWDITLGRKEWGLSEICDAIRDGNADLSRDKLNLTIKIVDESLSSEDYPIDPRISKMERRSLFLEKLFDAQFRTLPRDHLTELGKNVNLLLRKGTNASELEKITATPDSSGKAETVEDLQMALNTEQYFTIFSDRLRLALSSSES